MDDPTWLALAVVLTALGALWTVYAWRSRGASAALRAAGITLLAPAAYLTGTLELAGEIAVDVGDWASGLVFSPIVWTGVGLAGGGVLLFLLGKTLAARGVGTTPRAPRSAAAGGENQPVTAGQPRRAVNPPAAQAPASRGSAPADDDLDDIEAILRRRGIE